MKYFILFISIAFSLTQSQGQNAPVTVNDNQLQLANGIRTGKLPNGLTYYIMKNSKPENRMELRLAVNAGSTSEDQDQQGLAHFVEHMAFNGTTHFKKNELVDYLESIGTKFGPHLNAYTSFDETVYMMQVPTDSAPQMNKAFQILEDWAHGLSFDSIEVQKERGVVIEEWRLRQGAFERLRNQYWPVLFRGSRYEMRMPIGQKEVIEKAPIAKVKSFYKDWYRPDLMAVVAVGDFDVDAVEQKIISHFSKLTNPKKERALTKWDVLPTPNIEVAIARDKEAPYSSVQVIYKMPTEEVKTEGDFRRQLMQRLYNGMMSARLEEMTKKSDAPFTYANCGYGELVRYKNSYASFAIVNDQNIVKGLTALIDENERVKRFGFVQTEFDRQVKQMQRSLEKQMNEMSKTESSRFTSRIVSGFLNNRTYIGTPKEMELFQQYIHTIRIEEINEMAREWLKNPAENCVLIVSAPDKPSVKIPDEDGLMNIVRDIGKRKISPYFDLVSDKPFIAKAPVAGKINAEQVDASTGFTELKLSNGAKVIYKKTEFKNDEIQFRGFSWGGASLYPVDKDICISEAPGVIANSGLGDYDNAQLTKYLSDKIVNVRPYISETSEGFFGNASPQDLETMMQMVYLYFTAPRKDTTGFKSYMSQQKSFIENRVLDPESAYEDTIEVTMSGYSPRRRPWNLALLNEIKLDCAYDLFKERFTNAADFTFMFVGNIPEDQFKKLCMTYLASLPTANLTETWKDVGINMPKGKIKKTVKKGVEPKSSVTMKFTGNAQFSSKENMDLKVLMKLMSIKLREVLREENSGTYGVSCYGSIARIPKQEFTVTVEFGCAPENIDKLTKAALAVIDEVQSNGCEEKNLLKVKETFRREREVNLKENNWWMSAMGSYVSMGDKVTTQQEFDDYFSKLKSDDFKAAAQKYFNKENYAYFSWMPQ